MAIEKRLGKIWKNDPELIASNDFLSFMKVYLSIVLILTNYLQMEHLGSLPLRLG